MKRSSKENKMASDLLTLSELKDSESFKRTLEPKGNSN